MADFPEIRIDVGIDESSISSSYDKIIAKTKSLEESVQSAMSKLSSSGGGASAVKSFEGSIEEITRLFNSLRREMSEQLSLSVGVDTSKIASDFAEARSGVLSSLSNMEASIQQSALSGEINLTRLTDAVSLTQDSLSELSENAFASEASMRELSESFSSLGDSAESISSIGEVGDELKESLMGIASVTDKVSDNTNQLEDSLEDVSATLKDTGKQSENTSKGIKNLGNSSDIASNAISGLVKKLLLLVSVDKLKDLASESIELSSSLIELKNVTDTVFGDSAYLIEEFAKTSIDSFGLAEVSAKEYASTIGAILGATGLKDTIGSDALAQMSVNLTRVTADMASFRNMEFDEVFNKLKSGITGETEAIKSLGVALYESDMQEYMLRNGIDGTWSSLDNNTKILLRYNKIMQDTSFVQGDFQKTSDSFANSTKVLHERWTELLTLWGNYLIPAIAPAINVLGNLLAVLSEVTTQMAQLFGWADYQVISNGLVSNTASVSDYLANGVSEADDLTSSVKAAGDQAKKSLAPFSELNILSSSQTGSSGGGASFSAGEAKVDIANPYEDSKTISYLDELKSKLDKLKISKEAEKIVDFLKDVWDFLGKIAPLAEGVLVGILSYTILKKLATGWGNLVGNVGDLKKIFSGNFTGDTKTKIEKLAAAAGVAVTEFKSLQTVFKELVLDKFNVATGELEMTFGDIAIAIGAAVGLVGTASVALYALLGPAGLLVSGFALALAGIEAYTEYQDKVFQSSLERNLGGTQDFSEALDGLMKKNFSEVSASLGELETALGNLNGQQEEFDATVGSFEQLLTVAIGLDGNLENLPDKLQALGDSVTNQAKSLLDANYQWAVYEVMMSGLSEGEKAEAIDHLTESYNDSVAGVDAFSDALKKAGEDGEISAEDVASLSDSLVNVQDMLGTEAEVDLGIDINIEDIDLSDLDQVKTAMDDVTGELELLEEDFATKRKESIARLVFSGMFEEEATETFDTSRYAESYREALKGLQDDVALIYTEYQEGLGQVIIESGSSFDLKAAADVNIAFETANKVIVDSQYGAGATADEIFKFKQETLDKVTKAEEDLEKDVRAAYPDGFMYNVLGMDDWVDAAVDLSSVDFYQYADGVGTSFPQGYADGVADPTARAAVNSSAEAVVKDALETAEDTQDSHSPSKKTEQFGLYFVQGYALGISENQTIVEDAVTALVSSLLSILSEKSVEMKTSGETLTSKLAEGISSGKSSVVTAFKTVLDALSDSVNTWLDSLADTLSKTSISLSAVKSSDDIQTASATIKSIAVPKLATGAVIQPNNEFISILGDQRNGVNIESPLSTMVDAFTRALDSRGSSGFSGVIQIPVYVDGELSGMQVIDTQELERYRSNGK